MSIIIQYYGAFRALGTSITLDIDAPVRIADIKIALGHQLGSTHTALIGDSVLANDSDILQDDTLISDVCTLSILPPVCGG
jgi:molybdopterin converting factor small subunit